jgi:hypothetical protein
MIFCQLAELTVALPIGFPNLTQGNIFESNLKINFYMLLWFIDYRFFGIQNLFKLDIKKNLFTVNMYHFF